MHACERHCEELMHGQTCSFSAAMHCPHAPTPGNTSLSARLRSSGDLTCTLRSTGGIAAPLTAREEASTGSSQGTLRTDARGFAPRSTGNRGACRHCARCVRCQRRNRVGMPRPRSSWLRTTSYRVVVLAWRLHQLQGPARCGAAAAAAAPGRAARPACTLLDGLPSTAAGDTSPAGGPRTSSTPGGAVTAERARSDGVALGKILRLSEAYQAGMAGVILHMDQASRAGSEDLPNTGSKDGHACMHKCMSPTPSPSNYT